MRKGIALLTVLLLLANFDWFISSAPAAQLERVSTAIPFPRGLAVADGKMYVLARGRVRDAGGVSAEINDRAGTLFAIDPAIAESIAKPEVGAAVRNNGAVIALPAEPPFKLWNRAANPPEKDRETDRPYCTLRYHQPTGSLYFCAFSGIDKSNTPGSSTFSKNLSDGLLRYDLRTSRWYEVERHKIEAGGNYPHHDPRFGKPPHGWLNGPDNCLALGNWLYAVAKDNSLLVRYDLSALIDNPEAGAPPSAFVLGSEIELTATGRRNFFGIGRRRSENNGEQILSGKQQFYGHSALAFHDGMLYLAYRTSSVIVRFPLDENYNPVQPIKAELVAQFDPYDPETRKSANITDIDFDPQGRLYVISASPAQVYRFTPDPQHIYDGRSKQAEPWANLAALTSNPKMKSENVLCHNGWLYITSGDGYDYQQGAAGTVYRVKIED